MFYAVLLGSILFCSYFGWFWVVFVVVYSGTVVLLKLASWEGLTLVFCFSSSSLVEVVIFYEVEVVAKGSFDGKVSLIFSGSGSVFLMVS